VDVPSGLSDKRGVFRGKKHRPVGREGTKKIKRENLSRLEKYMRKGWGGKEPLKELRLPKRFGREHERFLKIKACFDGAGNGCRKDPTPFKEEGTVLKKTLVRDHSIRIRLHRW